MSLRRNSLFSAAEVVVSGICLFLIYRQVVSVLGVSMLGVWGLVLSTTAFGRAADLGIAGALSRFVARSLGEGDAGKAVNYMRTGVTFMAVAMGAVVLAIWAPLWWCLDFALDGEDLAAARSVLPWAVLSIWLLMVKTAFDSCLLGVHRADLRSVAGMLGMGLQLVASFALMGSFGLHGLAWAQAGQFALAIGLEVTFLLTVARVQVVGGLGGTWFSRTAFREMLGFGVKLQIGSLANLLFDPLTKSVLGAVAGTQALGIYEICYRATYQVRNVATMALQPTVPVLAAATARSDGELGRAFSRACGTASRMALILMPSVALASPVLSWLFLGSVEPSFVVTTGILCVAWTATILAAPSYFLGIAMGNVWPYVAGEVLACVVASVAVYALGSGLTAGLAVIGIALGKIVGSAIPAALNRPDSGFVSSALAHRAVLRTLTLVSVISLATAGVASAYV